VKNCWRTALCSILIVLITACTGVNTAVCEYKIDSFSPGKIMQHSTKQSLLVSLPTVSAGYDTDRMLYTDTPYSLHSFAHNEWISSPGNMLYPLIIQSLQQSNYFFAVIGGTVSDPTDYRLDTQVIALHQNFIFKPSVVELVVQGVLTHVDDQKVIASRIFTERVPCASNTPYAGVVAANQAAKQLTARLSDFVRVHVVR
jgi:cholesterol transport system auxiliary component